MGPNPRQSFKDARCVVVKVGTSVVTRPDGSLAIGRIASVVEQIAQDMSTNTPTHPNPHPHRRPCHGGHRAVSQHWRRKFTAIVHHP